jgi:hypothetical protein
MLQLHYPGMRVRDDGPFGVTLNDPNNPDTFAVIELCGDPLHRTFIYADESDVDRLLDAATRAKALFDMHRPRKAES